MVTPYAFLDLVQSYLGINRYGVTIFSVLIALAAGAMTSACGKKAAATAGGGAAPAQESAKKTFYQCPMHHQIVRTRPGECPICHMTLRKIETDPPDPPENAVPEAASFQLDARQRQLIGLRTATAAMLPMSRTISAPGRIAFDPELYAAIEEYRQAMRTRRSLSRAGGETRKLGRSIARSAAIKLRLLGLSNAQIKSLGGKNPVRSLDLILPQRGRKAWVYIDVAEEDAPYLRQGENLAMTSRAHPGSRFHARISAIDPTVNPITRTLRARAEISDPGGLFKPDEYVDAAIEVPLGTRLAVPEEAVLDTGLRRLAFLARPDGTIEPRAVETGARGGGDVEILSGLRPGDNVVASAVFLIDSEARLKSAVESFGGDEKKSEPSMPGMKM
jgi:Cu(I)/Ag(I) efflux system membrane fusion protein